MIALGKTRWVQVLIGENHWKDAVLSQLETGDVFRLAEPNGAPVDGGKLYVVREPPRVAVQEWPAKSDAAVISLGVQQSETAGKTD